MADIPYRPMVKTPWSGSRSARPMGAPSQEMMTPMAPSQGALDMVNVGMNGVGNYAPPSTGIVNPPTPVPPPPAMGTYGAMGLTPPPATQIHQGQQTPGYYQSIGAPNPSGVNAGVSAYQNMPAPQPSLISGMNAGQIGNAAIHQGQQQNQLDSRWAMQQPVGLRPGPAYGQQRVPEPPASMQNLPVGMPQPGGTRVTSRVVAVPDSEHGTRKVVLGMNADPLRVPDKRERITVDTGGDHKKLTPDQLEANRAAYRKRAADRKASLAEGRRQRAINEYGLDHLKPQQTTQGQESDRGGPQFSGGANPQQPGNVPTTPGAPAADISQRQAMLDKTLQHAIFTHESAKQGFDGSKASFMQSIDFYGKHSTKWSDNDKKAFKGYLDSRYGLDGPDGEFRKTMDQILSNDTHVANPDSTSKEQLESINAIRKMYGKPPMSMGPSKRYPPQYVPGHPGAW